MGEPGTLSLRLEALERVVEALRARKSRESDGQLTDDDAEAEASQLASLVPAEASATFDPTSQAPSWLPPGGLVVKDYDLHTTLWSVLTRAYHLGDIVVVELGTAELRFRASSWPYGGVTSLVRLTEAFGFELIQADNGTDILMPESFAHE